MPQTVQEKWLLVFYSVPSKPVSNRMKLWRRLAKTGAVQLKGAVYILPSSEEHYELFQWLMTEVSSMGGDGAFVRVNKIESMTDVEIQELFTRQREQDYRSIEKQLDDIDRKLSSMRKGTGSHAAGKLSEQLRKLLREYHEIHRLDFFSSTAGSVLQKRLKTVEGDMKAFTGVETKIQAKEIPFCRIRDFAGKVWITRKKPFIDRMASAWLIRKFIDPAATFQFIDDQNIHTVRKGTVTFDMRGGQFTHQGDFCTFEVLVRAFNIKIKPLKRIAELVHELDMKDGKFSAPETAGLEEILTGIRKTTEDDHDTLEKGMAVFEMLYASKSY